MGSVCLPQLPDACANLAGLSDVANLATNVADCSFQLGPFVAGNTLNCLQGGLVNGDEILACLSGTLGFGLSDCEPAAPACVSALPPDCNLLSNFNGFDLPSKLQGCVASIGSGAADIASKCLSLSSILSTTMGSSITDCLLDVLKGVCMPTLPDACLSLISLNVGQLTTQLPQCIAALGPFNSGGVLNCFTNPTSGPGIVLCLNKEIFGLPALGSLAGLVGLPSLGGLPVPGLGGLPSLGGVSSLVGVPSLGILP
ncbi:uncharacterized protein MAM_07087 [Metarhizium album ARSEF 1941]|uniref:Uncharacterized protein n=1 Tax=Metarhizium album (strain ARSEF 1941) TaxID=1081103 RepID=A0A0B2WM59_METAS|nr:uncharacterized protein MAM_07087 [Metarhizium album ARSEF 1941]KHN95038.1 hypothetical protein MAM_07087 [Metarhizium album ARSEF 1941]